ncbi:32 kda heat shock protein [Anaeramoeba flamelloides]|uniref:32 kDa heat shock protein n=1 Tax=Anaeramoeba flamelloides TaxID=1746091 RepID=A0ABQ8Z0Y9_9EUKA|nr:32 kda heat shock protein [Anaeramoeba flamelloides]
MHIQNQRKFAIDVIWIIEKRYGTNSDQEKKKVEKKEKEIQKIKKEKEIHGNIVNALRVFLLGLKKNNKYRSAIIHKIIQELQCFNIKNNFKEYSSALGVTVQTIKRHLNMEKEGDILFSTSYFLKNMRNKLSNEEIMVIIQTWLELCTCKSGDYKQVWNGRYEDAVEDDDNDDGGDNAKNDGDEEDDDEYGGGTGSACIDACCGLNEFNHDNRILVYNMNSIVREKDSNKKKETELNKEINQTKKRKRIFVTRRHQTQTDKKICQQIQEKMIKNGFQKRCNNTYLKYKPKEVKQYSYLRCYDATNCNICEQNNISKKFISNNIDKNTEEFKFHQKKIENYEIHLQEINTQRSSYIDNKNDLKLNEVIFVFDFGAFYPPSGIKKENNKISDLCICKITKNKEEKLQYDYYDFISSHISQDYNYVKSSFEYLFNLGIFKNYSKIYFWSDNGQHFKNHKTFNYFYNLSNNIGIRIIQNFFIACHAANECDGHFGVLKRKEKEAKKMGNCLFSVDEYCTFAQNITKKTISFNLKKLNTYQNEELLYSGMKGIRQIHQIIYNFNNILCKNLSNDSDFIINLNDKKLFERTMKNKNNVVE